MDARRAARVGWPSADRRPLVKSMGMRGRSRCRVRAAGGYQHQLRPRRPARCRHARSVAAFRQNRVTRILETLIHYQTDTLGGSSGSPVFNDQWELIALHHDAVAQTDAQGNWLDVEGRPSGLDEERTHWIANMGTRVSSILAAVRQADVDTRRRAFVKELKR